MLISVITWHIYAEKLSVIGLRSCLSQPSWETKEELSFVSKFKKMGRCGSKSRWLKLVQTRVRWNRQQLVRFFRQHRFNICLKRFAVHTSNSVSYSSIIYR